MSAAELSALWLVLLVWVARASYARGLKTGRDAQWCEDAMALQRELAARRDRAGRYKSAPGPLVLPPRNP